MSECHAPSPALLTMPDNTSTLMPRDQNSKRTRVEPVFRWLKEHGDPKMWPAELLRLAHGFGAPYRDPGGLVPDGLYFEPEMEVPPLPSRLLWMLENLEDIKPTRKKSWPERRKTVQQHPGLTAFKRVLCSGMIPYRKREKRGPGRPNAILFLEGPTFGDAVVVCEKMVIWVEGKRTEPISKSTNWDSERDQIARNLEAAWQLARCPSEDDVKQGTARDIRVLICHESAFRGKDRILVKQYQERSMRRSWRHLDRKTQKFLSSRLGVLQWTGIVHHWRKMCKVRELQDVQGSL